MLYRRMNNINIMLFSNYCKTPWITKHYFKEVFSFNVIAQPSTFR